MRFVWTVVRPLHIEFWSSWYYVALLRVKLLGHGRNFLHDEALHLLLFSGVTAVRRFVSIVALVHITCKRGYKFGGLPFILWLKATTCGVIYIVTNLITIQSCHVSLESPVCTIVKQITLSSSSYSFSCTQTHGFVCFGHPVRVPRVAILLHGHLPAESERSLIHTLHMIWICVQRSGVPVIAD